MQAYGTCCDSVYYNLQLTEDFNKYMYKPIFLYQIINTRNTLLRVISFIVARILHAQKKTRGYFGSGTCLGTTSDQFGIMSYIENECGMFCLG